MYEIDSDSGTTTIIKSGAGDTLQFGDGISQSDLTTSTSIIDGLTATTITAAEGPSVTLVGGSLGLISFADGSSTTLSLLVASSYTQGANTYSTVDATAGAGITALDMTGSADVTATGNSLNDIITANSGDDTLIAGSGNDTLVGGAGSNTYVVGGGAHVTTIQKSSTGDTLSLATGVGLI